MELLQNYNTTNPLLWDSISGPTNIVITQPLTLTESYLRWSLVVFQNFELHPLSLHAQVLASPILE